MTMEPGELPCPLALSNARATNVKRGNKEDPRSNGIESDRDGSFTRHKEHSSARKKPDQTVKLASKLKLAAKRLGVEYSHISAWIPMSRGSFKSIP